MNAGVERAGQPGFPRSVQCFKVIAEEFAEPLAAEYRLAIRRGAIDHDRQRFNKLPERAFSLEQRLLCVHQIIDVEGDRVPLHNGSALVSHRFRAAINPTIGPVRTTHAIFHGLRLAGDEGLADRFSHVGHIVGMDESLQGGRRPLHAHLVQIRYVQA